MKDRLGFFRGMRGHRSSSGIRPYQIIAGVYDRIMDHVDYRAWASYIDALFTRFHPGVRTVFETACGTGSLSIVLSSFGYSVHCMDSSPEMAKRAVSKLAGGENRSWVITGDMTAIPVSDRYDAVICIYDSINYMLDEDMFKMAVREAGNVIKDGGLFIFDVCTVRNSELFFNDGEMHEEIADIVYERYCRFYPEERIQENRFILTRDGKSIGSECHRQKIWYLDEIAVMCKEMPFQEIARYDDLSFRPGTEDSDRVHFVFRRLPRDDKANLKGRPT